MGNQAGGWTLSWQGASGQHRIPGNTILDGIRQVAPEAQVTYSKDGSAPMARRRGVVVVGETPYSEGFGDVGGPHWAYDPEDAGVLREPKSLELQPGDTAVVSNTAVPCRANGFSCVLFDNCGGLTCPPTSPVRRWTRRPSGCVGRASRSRRARCGRPRWPTSASTSRADRRARRARAARSDGSPTSVTARRCARCSARRPPTDRSRCRWSTPSSRSSATGTPRGPPADRRRTSSPRAGRR